MWELESSASFLGGREEGSWPSQSRSWCLGNTGPRLESSVKFCLQVVLERSYLRRESLVHIWSAPRWWSHLAVILQEQVELQGLRLLEAVAWLQAKHMYPNKDMLLLRERRKAKENRTCDFGELRVKRSRKGLMKTCKWAKSSPVAMQCRDSCQPGVTTRLKNLLTKYKYKPSCLDQFCISLSWCWKSVLIARIWPAFNSKANKSVMSWALNYISALVSLLRHCLNSKKLRLLEYQ